MAPMKAMKAGAKAMSQGALAQALSESTELKKAVCAKAVKLGGDWHTAGEERRQVRATWLVHDQDAFEAGDESGQAGGLRQGRHGQGQASKDRGEGLPRLSIEEGFLSIVVCHFSECSPWRKHAEHAFRALGRLF